MPRPLLHTPNQKGSTARRQKRARAAPDGLGTRCSQTGLCTAPPPPPGIPAPPACPNRLQGPVSHMETRNLLSAADDCPYTSAPLSICASFFFVFSHSPAPFYHISPFAAYPSSGLWLRSSPCLCRGMHRRASRCLEKFVVERIRAVELSPLKLVSGDLRRFRIAEQ